MDGLAYSGMDYSSATSLPHPFSSIVPLDQGLTVTDTGIEEDRYEIEVDERVRALHRSGREQYEKESSCE